MAKNYRPKIDTDNHVIDVLEVEKYNGRSSIDLNTVNFKCGQRTFETFSLNKILVIIPLDKGELRFKISNPQDDCSGRLVETLEL